MRAENANVKSINCECGQNICFKCGNAFHGKFSNCNDAMDQQFIDWVKEKDVRFCPKCKVRIEKDMGCNHMTCYYCSFEFCWICGATYTKDHF